MNDSPAQTTTPVRPPFDPELVPIIALFRSAWSSVSAETLPAVRAAIDDAPVPDFSEGGKVVREDREIPGSDGAPPLAVSVFSPSSQTHALPVIHFVHGGGMVGGNRFTNVDEYVALVAEGGVVVVSAEYRLAPEHRAPAQVEDCYRALTWIAENATELSIDPDRIMIAGISAGGGLAAGTALMARDRGFPALTHQILASPMIDDRLITHSSRMLDGEGCWDVNENLFGWECALGSDRGGPDVPAYVAPARAEDLSGLPRTHLDCGSADGFRDEIFDYATRLSQAGVSVDFHLWGGGFHGFDTVSEPALSRSARAARSAFIRRALAERP